MLYIYENWTHHRARLHVGECPYCNNGAGTQPSDSGRNGRWLGPFSDRDAAIKMARSLKNVEFKPCGHCSG